MKNETTYVMRNQLGLREEVLEGIADFGLPERYEHIRVTLMYAKGNYNYEDYATRFFTWTDEQRIESDRILRDINNETLFEISLRKQPFERQDLIRKNRGK